MCTLAFSVKMSYSWSQYFPFCNTRCHRELTTHLLFLGGGGMFILYQWGRGGGVINVGGRFCNLPPPPFKPCRILLPSRRLDYKGFYSDHPLSHDFICIHIHVHAYLHVYVNNLYTLSSRHTITECVMLLKCGRRRKQYCIYLREKSCVVAFNKNIYT